MEFIGPKQFLDKDKKVHEIIDNSIELCVGDRIYNLINKKYYIFLGFEGKLNKVYKVCDLKEKCIEVFAAEVFIKCPTEGQIRKFIEDKMGCTVILVNNSSLNIELWLGNCWNRYKTNTHDVLQAYWQAAVQIAKEISEHEQ